MSNVEMENAISSATSLLSASRSRHRVEANVQSDVVAVLRELQLGTIEEQYQTGGGPVDIFLPNKSSFIEVKPYPKARDPYAKQSGREESAKEQLDRYVYAELAQEDLIRSINDNFIWNGIITDGRHWHFFEYPHDRITSPSLVESLSLTHESPTLINTLVSTFGTEMQGKEWIPQHPHKLFSSYKDELESLYTDLPSNARESTNTKFQLWLDMMTTSGLVPPDEVDRHRLFLVHSFLIIIVRLVSHSMTNAIDHWRLNLKDVFCSWVLDFARGQDWCERIYLQIESYDWKKRRTDVFRELYQEFVDDEDKKLYGEFYTPDWLAETMVETVLDDKWIEESVHAVYSERIDGVGVLDPTCGSGTFLYHAALRLSSSEHLRDYPPGRRSDIICRLVNGIDIHPVAVEITKVNIERAIPSSPTEGRSALQVYLGDSLQIHQRDELYSARQNYLHLLTPGNVSTFLPMQLVRHPNFDEYIRRIVNAAAEKKPLPGNLPKEINHGDLVECHKKLVEIIEKEGNSIWAWYCTNLAGPTLLKERKVNRLVANPPWVKFSDIQVLERKRDLENLAISIDVHVGGKQAPHTDIASLFVIQARQLYLENAMENPGGWLVKVSALRSGQWLKFRKKHRSNLRQSIDLTELNPFHGGDSTRCCVLFEHCFVEENPNTTLVARKSSRRKIDQGESNKSAKTKYYLDVAPEPIPQKASDYLSNDIRQGATIVPHVLCRLGEPPSKPDIDGWVSVSTYENPNADEKWEDVESQTGKVPFEWISPIYTSLQVLVLRAPLKTPSKY